MRPTSRLPSQRSRVWTPPSGRCPLPRRATTRPSRPPRAWTSMMTACTSPMRSSPGPCAASSPLPHVVEREGHHQDRRSERAGDRRDGQREVRAAEVGETSESSVEGGREGRSEDDREDHRVRRSRRARRGLASEPSTRLLHDRVLTGASLPHGIVLGDVEDLVLVVAEVVEQLVVVRVRPDALDSCRPC